MADIIAGRKAIGKLFYQYGFGEKLSSVPQKRLTEIICGLATEYETAISAIDELPGIGRRSAEVILAEIGTDMSSFPSTAHIASWSGLCPGNHQSAGRRKHGKTTKGNKTLKSILVECAKSARNVKDSYFSAQYQRIAARRGKNLATVQRDGENIVGLHPI